MFFERLIKLDTLDWMTSFTNWGKPISLLLTTTVSEENSALVFASVLLSLIVIYVASKIGGELSNKVGLPPVLGELVGGVIVGISALHLLVFPEGGEKTTSSVIMNLIQTTEGQIILGAAVIDDVLGIILLAVVVASLAKTGQIDVSNVIYLIISASGFLLGAIALGNNVFNNSFVAVVNLIKTRGELVIPAFIFAFVMAYLAAAIHLEAILGAFAAFLCFGGNGQAQRIAKASSTDR